MRMPVALRRRHEPDAPWYTARAEWICQRPVDLAGVGLPPVANVSLTGGRFWQQTDFEANSPGKQAGEAWV